LLCLSSFFLLCFNGLLLLKTAVICQRLIQAFLLESFSKFQEEALTLEVGDFHRPSLAVVIIGKKGEDPFSSLPFFECSFFSAYEPTGYLLFLGHDFLLVLGF
jgi:hypothetical protein